MTSAVSPLDPNDVAAHADSVRSLARRLVRDSASAEDIAQETWLVALRGTRREGVPLRWWLAGVVRNVTRHVRRDEATRRRHEQVAPSSRDAERPDTLVERTEVHHRLVGAVLSLEEPYRAAILMRYFEDLSAAEIARRSGVPAGTVRSRLKRGLDMLRARLDDDHDGDRRAWVVALVPFAWSGETRSGVPTIARIAACLLLLAVASVVALRPWGAATNAKGEAESAAASADAKSPAAGSDSARRDAVNRPGRIRADTPDSRSAADEDATPKPAESVANAPADGATGVSVEVVDEDGARVGDATVKLDLAEITQIADLNVDLNELFEAIAGDKPMSGKNPLVVAGLPKSADGLDLKASASVPGLPPTAPGRFTVRAGKIATVRVVAVKPRKMAVLVVDRETDLPVANASVVSETELGRRDVEPAAARGTAAPGSAVTGADGRCEVGGLGRGEHEIEIQAPGYLRGEAKWTDGEIRVRLEPQRGAGTVTVTVLGVDGLPLPGIGVKLFRSDRTAKTDSAGRAVFSDVPPGFAAAHVDVADWVAACKARGWNEMGATWSADVNVEAGGAYEMALGHPVNKASVAVRVVDENDAPITGVKAALSGRQLYEATSDANGEAAFPAVSAGRFHPHLDFGRRARWWFDDIDLAAGAHLESTWKLGANTIRGRVVAGADRHGVAGVDVYALGPGNGRATTDAEGRFELPSARSGIYSFSADAKQQGVPRRRISIPSEAEIVLEMVDHGRVAIRFLAADRPQLRDAKIRVVAAGEDGDETVEDGKGEDDFVAPQLLPGSYEVEVVLAGRAQRFPVEVKSGETSVVEVRVP